MGIKRWLLALLILVVVLVFVGFIFLQSGADSKISGTIIPAIEKKFGLYLKYEDVSVSLTSVMFKNVEISDEEGALFARIERLAVGLRVGPLLLGKIDITGLRVDGMILFVGKEAGGAPLKSWMNLKDQFKDKQEPSSAVATKSISVPEIYLSKGDLYFNDGSFKGKLEQLSGRITPGSKALCKVGNWLFKKENNLEIKGNEIEFLYDFALRHFVMNVSSPFFSMPLEKDKIKELADAFSDSLNDIKKETSIGEEEDDDNERVFLDIIVKINGAKGQLITGEAGEHLPIEKVAAELTVSDKQLFSIRANGSIEGIEKQWAAQMSVEKDRTSKLVIEVPVLPLRDLGPVLIDNSVVDWQKGTASVHLSIEHDGAHLRVFEGQSAFSGIDIEHEKIGAKITEFDGNVDFRASLDSSRDVLTFERLNFSRGLARFGIRGSANLDRLAFDLNISLAQTACRHFLSFIPLAIKERIGELNLEGSIGFNLHVALDLQQPDNLILDGNLDNKCKIAGYGAVPSPDTYRRPFRYMAYDEKGARMEIMSGPGSDRWVPIALISPYIIETVLTTEDGKFEFHKGLTLPEVRRAVLTNITKGGMFHGASTITMQLAKNLFLSRDRTIKRKLQELFFTWYLESNFTKDEIMELYLNIIEFGPSIYGIGEAAEYYFGRHPQELRLAESVFLVRLFPNPVARHSVKKEGRLSEPILKGLHRIMDIMHRRKRITDAELAIGKKEEVIFYSEGDSYPDPRPPVNRDRINGIDSIYEDDSAMIEIIEDEANWDN